MHPHSKRIILFLLTLSIIPIACTIFVGGPEYPADKINTSEEALRNLNDQLTIAGTESALTGKITINVDETQVTSILANRLASQPDPIFQEPQVYFQNGEIQVYGKVNQGNLQANVRIVLNASVDENGKPVIKIISTDFGPFPATDGLNQSISALVDQAFNGSIGPVITGMRLETIEINNGVLKLTGRTK